MRMLVAVLMLCLSHVAFAHQAPSGWTYDATCCSNRDCAELPEAETPKPLDGGDWRLTTGEIVPRDKVKFSPDGKFHLCRWNATGAVLCLYVPPSSS